MRESSSPGSVVIGDGVKVTGKLEMPGTAVIDGEVEGEVVANEVRVGTTGRISGSVTTSRADIFGQVEKDVTVTDTLILRAAAKVRGSVVYEVIEIEQGATVEGELKRSTNERRAEPAPRSTKPVVSASPKAQAEALVEQAEAGIENPESEVAKDHPDSEA